MFQISLVVFREIVEIALIIGILTAVTKNIVGRGKYIVTGLLIGLTCAFGVAFFTDKISESLNGFGQEFFNGVVLITAASMISWTVLWMQKHARSLSGEFKKVSESIIHGKKPLYALLFIAMFSVLREGTEIVLFTYSYYISGEKIINIIYALIIGLCLGASVGVALYFGMLKAFGRYFFIVTSWILVFLSSGIMAQGVGLWVNAEILPAFGNPIFDLSWLLCQENLFGKFMHIFFGYIDKPSGMQLLVYLGNVSLLSFALHRIKSQQKKSSSK